MLASSGAVKTCFAFVVGGVYRNLGQVWTVVALGALYTVAELCLQKKFLVSSCGAWRWLA